MKTFQEFLEENNGDFVEVAGSPNALNQCVDLVNAYIRDVLGLPIIEWTNAIDFPKRAGEKYTWIVNTPSGVPQEGDIVVWGSPYGKYIENGVTKYAGHVAIFISGNADKFKSFDQNYPIVGSNCHVQDHTYNGVLGWLHPKEKPNTALTECLRQHGELVTKLEAIDGFRKAISKVLFQGNENMDWQSIFDQITSLTKEVDESRKLGRIANDLWDVLVEETGISTVKYEPDSLGRLLQALPNLRNTPPEGKVIVSKAELDDLKEKASVEVKKLADYELSDLLPVTIAKVWESLYGLVKRAPAEGK